MDNINWKYFVVAAEEHNFTKAASKLFISQQSLSNYIVKLENNMGVELFNRKANLALTEAGECLYRNAIKILMIEEQTEQELQDIRDFRTSTLRIGISGQLGAKVLPKVLPDLKVLYPNLKIELHEKGVKNLEKDLIDGKIDLMYAYEELKHKDMACEIYKQDRAVIVLSEKMWKQYFMEEERKEILSMEKVPLEYFTCCPFVLLKEGNWQNIQIRDYCNKKGITLNVLMRTAMIDTMVNLASVGYCATICQDKYVQKEYMSKNLKIQCFYLDDPIFSPNSAIIYMKNRYLPKVMRDLIKISKINLK